MGGTQLHTLIFLIFVLLIKNTFGNVEGKATQNTTSSLNSNVPAFVDKNSKFASNGTRREGKAGTLSTVINCHNCSIHIQDPGSGSYSDGDRIVGGRPASEGQFPHQVSLRTPSNNQHFCGGSILHTMKHILTAAHCVPGLRPAQIVVVAGTNYLNSGGIAVGVARITSHSSYNPQTNAYDLAVLELQNAFTPSAKIQPITLSNYVVPAGTRLFLSGWGLTAYPSNYLPNNLQYVQLTAIDLSTCQQRLPGYPVYNIHLCTESPPGQGGCQGDSGGPLIDRSSGRSVQVGVVSWGIPCAKGRPDVFTSVTALLPWINQQTG